MKTNRTRNARILAISLSSRGFGFAVSEGQETLVDWGVKSVQGDKNRHSLAKIKDLITHYRPDTLLLEDMGGKHSRRSARIQTLGLRTKTLASDLNVQVMLLSQKRIRHSFFRDGGGTRYELAQILVEQFPEELGQRLPPKRKPWQCEDSRMDIFMAVALVVMFRSLRPIPVPTIL
jgi:hypothetical protein